MSGWMDGVGGGNSGGRMGGCARVYFKFAKRRRIKGAFEEVLTVPMWLRIGPRAC